MKIYADIRREVHIDPLDVIEHLKESISGCNRGDYIFTEAGKYFRGYEVSAGCHSIDGQTEISKEKYDYYQSLCEVEKYLKNNKTK
jgi:hypothetical protein